MQNLAGRRVRLRYSVGLDYDVSGPSEFLLNVHAARTPRQRVIEESFALLPERTIALNEDRATGNRIASFDAPSGAVRVRYSALVEIAHRFVDPTAIVPETPATLPACSLHFLYASRYCQVDLVQQQAWDRFGHLTRGYGQVRAVRDWVRENLVFRVGASGPATSVIETLRDGAGVCRDFAHTMIAFCRALNYPARFVTGVDYGADPALGPPDFHAYVEAFVGGDWYLFDPTGISTITGLIRIGTGRDAADVSFATIFGPVRTGMPRVEFNAVEDAQNGVVLPSHCDLAVSTAHGPRTLTAIDDQPTGDRSLRATAFRSSGIRSGRARRRSAWRRLPAQA
jgi:transglutaminase-like putative cysteine protease